MGASGTRAAPVAAESRVRVDAHQIFAAAKLAPLGRVSVPTRLARDPNIEALRAVCTEVVADVNGKLGCVACPAYSAAAVEQMETEGAPVVPRSDSSVAYALIDSIPGSFTRAGAKERLLHLEGCSLLLGSDLVLVEQQGTRWVIARYLPLVQSSAIKGTRKARRPDGRDVAAFARAVQSMPGGLSTVTACEFAADEDTCWDILTTHYFGPCVEPEAVELTELKSFAFSNLNRDSEPDVVVEVDAVQMPAAEGSLDSFESTCGRRKERRHRLRLGFLRRGDDFVFAQRPGSEPPAEVDAAITARSMSSLR
jgi:hypothetical protein